MREQKKEKMTVEDIVLYFSLKYDGDFEKIYQALLSKEPVDETHKDELKESLKCQYTTIFSDDYPSRLRNINCPPFVLYYYGNLSLLDNKTIAIVGTRSPDVQGIGITNKFANHLSKEGRTIISGLSQGIDYTALKFALFDKGRAVAVSSTGIDNDILEDQHTLYDNLKNNGLIISEYPNIVQFDPSHSAIRHRLIAGLSDSVLVTQCKEKSESMYTVGYALDQGKDIFAVPSSSGDISLKGCNTLIKQGATLADDVKDILEANPQIDLELE